MVVSWPGWVLAATFAFAPLPDGPGTEVSGVVRFEGVPPRAIPNPEGGRPHVLLEVEPDSGGLKNAVVWLEGVPPSPDDSGAARGPLEVDQRDFRFEPRVLTVRAGRAVEFVNSDPANHGITASAPDAANRFNVSTPPGERYTHRFESESRPVAIGCPVHPAMRAWIFVFDHPYFALTDEEGRFRIPGVPEGRYTLRVEHADGGLSHRREVEVKATESRPVLVRYREADLGDASRDRSR